MSIDISKRTEIKIMNNLQNSKNKENIIVHTQPSQSTFQSKIKDLNQIRTKIWYSSLKVVIEFGRIFRKASIFRSKNLEFFRVIV